MSFPFGRITASLFLASAILWVPSNSRANVYATDIQISGTLPNTNSVLVPQSGSTIISYRLNQAATLGCTVTISSNGATVATIVGGTKMGLNTVVWGTTNNAGQYVGAGTYSISVTAAATGFTLWTQTSVDTNPGEPANFPLGIDVDKNSSSPYYGRVVFGCAITNANTNTPATAKKVGLYKSNADGTQADEGWYGNANYLEDDLGNPPVPGQMPSPGSTSGYNPRTIRIGDDDRIYWNDSTLLGAVLSCDILATQYQVVIDEGTKGTLMGPYNFSGNDDYGDYAASGFRNFDVAFLTTTNANLAPALFIGDNDYPNAGFWMYHLTNNGTSSVNTVNNVLTSDPNDTEGTQAIFAGSGSDISLVASGGIMVDTNLDLFVGESRQNENAVYDAVDYTNWNAGVLPPEHGAFNYSLFTQALWAYGCGVNTTCATDPSFEAVQDTVINSRLTPTVTACPLGAGSQFVASKTGGGIRLLNAQTGALITVTNGATVTTYSNLDNGQVYTGAAFDAVGNLYAVSTTRNLWRVYSPPGASTNTTTAYEMASVQPVAPSVALTTNAFSGDANSNATLTATYSGTAPLSLQFYSINNNNVTNAVTGSTTVTSTTDTLVLSNLLASQNGYQYFLVASNALGTATSGVATLTVYNAPQIVTNISPLTQVAAVGSTYSFSVSAVGAVPLSYQWYENGVAIPGQTNSTFVFTATLGTNTYYVNVSNSTTPAGVNSAVATVIASSTGLPVYEPFTEYAAQVASSGSNAIDLCTSGLTVASSDSLSTLTWGGLDYNGLAISNGCPPGLDVLVTNNSSSPFTQSALSTLLPATFPGFPSSVISVMAVNPSQTVLSNNIVGNSAVLPFAGDFVRPSAAPRTLYFSYLIAFAQKGPLGTGNDGRYLALLASTNVVEPSTPYPFWTNFFNTYGGSPRYASHGLFDISNTNAYIAPCDTSNAKEFTNSIYQASLGSNAPSGAPIFVVGAYVFNPAGQDTNQMWVNPSISSFGGTASPGTAQNDVLPAGYNMSDLGGFCLIDRVGSGSLGGVGTNYVANLLIGTTWSYVTGGPEFTIQPITAVATSNNVTLSANAVAAGQSVSYQWQHVTATTTNNVSNGAGGAGGSATVSGATTSSLTLTGVSAADAGTYQVVATASSTSYTLASSVAVVTVTGTSSSTGPTTVRFAAKPVTGAPSAPVLHFSGTAGGTYHVYSTTNLALEPVITKWTLIGTGTFSGGADTFACPVGSSAAQFYTITQP